jgi:hypothetical protein
MMLSDLLNALLVFSSSAIVLQSIAALNRCEWGTDHGVRLAYLGLALSSFTVFIESVCFWTVPTYSLVAVLIAVSLFMALDRRKKATKPPKES